jgi:DNA-binding SARP family transcriptional activator/tetratricopeptide (TPR) repeat protein
MIFLRALGTAEIDTGTVTLTPSQEIVFAAALYLIVERGKPVSRNLLASLLWPKVSEKARAHRLRQTILQLKKAGFIVTADRNNLQIAPNDQRIDFFELTGTCANTLATHPCLEFMPGYSPTFSATFRDWVDAQRDQAHALVTRELVTELNAARTKGDWLNSDNFARQCRKLDPFNETAVLAQAEASAMRGAKTRAIAILDQYLVDVGSDNPDLRLSASVLRRRITDRIPERTPTTIRECLFVGRYREMETLRSELLAARQGRGGTRLVRGEAGIGKSRLASELIKFAMLEGFQTIRTTCRRSDVDRPLSVLAALVPQLSELRGALGCSQETMSVLRGLTEFDGRATFNSLSVDDLMSAYARMRVALFDLLDAVADERSVLVVVDDVQWLDSSSVRLLTELIPWAQTRKVCLVLTERPVTKGLATHFSLDDLKTLVLGPLPSQFSEAIVAEVLKESPRPTTSELIQRLLALGGGNPFFLQELGNHWLETGEQRGSPPSVTAIIDERLARLSNEALLVLQACAVLDVNATIDRVEGVLEYKSHLLLSAVQELSVAGMLRAEPQTFPDYTEPLTVGHDLISTGALERLARAPLAFLHRRAGTVLERETLGNGARTAVLWACAFHWHNAGDRERAFQAACSCAEHLLGVGLPRDAGQAFERALDYCTTDEQRLLVLSRLALSLQMNGQWEASKEILRRSRQLQSKIAPNACIHDEVEFALFEARWRVSLENSALVDELKACAGSGAASASHRVACGLLGLKVASDENQIQAMGELYLTMAPLLEDPEIAAVTRLEVEVIYHSHCGDLQRGEKATDQLFIAARDQRDPGIRARALTNVGVAYRVAGRKDDAVAAFLELYDHSVAYGFLSRAWFACLALTRVYLTAGDFARARDAMTKLDAIAGVDQDLHRALDRLYLLARLALEEGNIKEASERYEAALAHFAPTQTVNRRAARLALGIRIGIHNEVSVAAIRPMVADLEAAHVQNRASCWQDFETCALTMGLRYCGELEHSERLLFEYVTKYRREKWALPQPLSDLLRQAPAGYAVPATRRMEPLSGVL